MTTALRIDMAPYLHGIVEPTVRDVWRRYGEDVDLDDLRQEAALWWYGPGQQYLQDYLDQDEKHVRLRRSIWRWCARYAERERAAHRGYSPVDQVRYSPVAILQMLPIALDPDGLPDGGGFREGPKPKGNLAEGGDVLAMLVDVRRAVHSLTFEDQAFLVLCEDLAGDWERVSANTGTLPDSVRRRHARIAERMARFLNNDLED
jgi:hypothetical protein